MLLLEETWPRIKHKISFHSFTPSVSVLSFNYLGTTNICTVGTNGSSAVVFTWPGQTNGLPPPAGSPLRGGERGRGRGLTALCTVDFSPRYMTSLSRAALMQLTIATIVKILILHLFPCSGIFLHSFLFCSQAIPEKETDGLRRPTDGGKLRQASVVLWCPRIFRSSSN